MQRQATADQDDPKYDTSGAAKYLGGSDGKLSDSTLEHWRVTGKGPKFVKMGRSVRYARSDLDKFIEENRRRSTSDQAA